MKVVLRQSTPEKKRVINFVRVTEGISVSHSLKDKDMSLEAHSFIDGMVAVAVAIFSSFVNDDEESLRDHLRTWLSSAYEQILSPYEETDA